MSKVSRPLSKSTFLLLFILCCSVPFIAAKLVLEFGWFNSDTSNKGQWLDREIQMLPGDERTQLHWHLVYVQASECDANCETALYMMQQLYIGLGRKQDEINTLVVADRAPQQLAKFSHIKWQAPLSLTPELQHHILIVNQKGLALLRYPVTTDPAAMLVIGKGIRTDLLRLMNYDRTGTK
jgi:hypothetical protein